MRMLPQLTAVFVAAASLLSVWSASRVMHTQPIVAPPPRPISAEHGRRLFVQSCAHCHGDDARGSGEDSDGPDLHDLAIGNARIAALIRSGVPDEMPSFAKKHGPEDIGDLTAYLRTLR